MCGRECAAENRVSLAHGSLSTTFLEYLAGGLTTDEIVADFPELTADHVRAALEFAAMRERRLAASA